MCQSGSVLPCFAETSTRGKISEKNNSVLRAQPLERPPQTLEFAEAAFKAVLCYDPSKRCASITIVTIIISISIVIMNQQPFKKCYKSQAKDWSPFLNPLLVILPHSASTLSLHPLVAANDSDCSGPQEQQKTPNDSNLEVRDGCVPVGHPTKSIMESGTCHGEIFMRESFECTYTWGTTNLEIEMS